MPAGDIRRSTENQLCRPVSVQLRWWCAYYCNNILWVRFHGWNIAFWPFRPRVNDPVNIIRYVMCKGDRQTYYTHTYSDGNEHFGVFRNSIHRAYFSASIYFILFPSHTQTQTHQFSKTRRVSYCMTCIRYPEIRTK